MLIIKGISTERRTAPNAGKTNKKNVNVELIFLLFNAVTGLLLFLNLLCRSYESHVSIIQGSKCSSAIGNACGISLQNKA
jgi:hypothetical protein